MYCLHCPTWNKVFLLLLFLLLLYLHNVFTSCYRFSPIDTHLTCRSFICQHSAIAETTICILYNNNKNIMYLHGLINWSHMYQKSAEFNTLYLVMTCVYQILPDHRDLQSRQIGQDKDVVIATPANPTLCTLGHQTVPRLVSGLDSMWHTSTRGFW